MVADYLSAAIASGANANPVFEVASQPTVGKTCSNLNTGAPGQNCNQATFTSLQALGGANAATAVPPGNLAHKNPTNGSRLTAY